MEDSRNRLRVSLPVAVIIGLAGSAITFAATWGATTERIKTLEETAKALAEQNGELRKIVAAQDVQIIQLKAYTEEAIRRLDRIERKLDSKGDLR